ncbi:MAG: sulfatase [Planctomycetes bacterium]|nr:sulfatase [Planctomycetota bacterium]
MKHLGAAAVVLTLPGCLSQGIKSPGATGKRPNFVFILIDDLGWMDVGYNGSKFYETPNIDKLAADGMSFTDAYAACPVCSPTRASIMSGKYPARLNITDWIGGGQKGMMLPAPYEHQLPLEEVTVAEMLQQAGYATGFIGKWHLGDEGYWPENQGFDLNIGGHSAGQPASYFYPYRRATPSKWDVPHLEGGAEGEYLTDRLTDESLKFIDANTDRPFLLFLSHYAVHTPIQSKDELTQKYKAKLAATEPPSGDSHRDQSGYGITKLHQDNAAYAGMMQSTDESVGRIIAKIDQLNLTENTVVIFMSDNGGLSTLARSENSPTSNVPLRAGKGWLYEGGIREPMIIKWPGTIKPNSICHEVVTSTDFFPTMLEMAGLPQLPNQHPDGQSLMPLLQQKGLLNRQAIYWHFPHYHGSGNRPSGAVRAGDYKLIEWYEDGRVELFNLKNDLSETNNLAETMPPKTAELKQMLYDWRQQVDARMPKPNPDWKNE